MSLSLLVPCVDALPPSLAAPAATAGSDLVGPLGRSAFGSAPLFLLTLGVPPAAALDPGFLDRGGYASPSPFPLLQANRQIISNNLLLL